MIYLPGDGCIYALTDGDDQFASRVKYCYVHGRFNEVSQPMQYIGMRSRAAHDLNLYSDESMTKQLGTISKGAFLEVLLGKGSSYLIRDSFGLVGWGKTWDASSHDYGEVVVGHGHCN